VGVVVPVYKDGGKDPLKMDSHRGITLTSMVSKGLEFLILERLQQLLPHSRVLIEKIGEYTGSDVCMICRLCRLPTSMYRNWYSGGHCVVKDSGGYSGRYIVWGEVLNRDLCFLLCYLNWFYGPIMARELAVFQTVWCVLVTGVGETCLQPGVFCIGHWPKHHSNMHALSIGYFGSWAPANEEGFFCKVFWIGVVSW
jgi:hypothetical protein